MKIALITDQHFGARDDDQNFDKYFEKFYTTVFFPFLKQHNIKHCVCLGDLFERRKYVNFVTLSRAHSYYFSWFDNNGVGLDTIIGNHDVFYKNTNDVNSPELLLSQYSNIKVITKATEAVLPDGTRVIYLPWINNENKEHAMKLLKETKAQVVFGHLELDGFEMYRGIKGTGMASTEPYEKFSLVCSGHYHHKSTQGNIHYLGAPYEMNWLDYGDRRGFHIFDTETRALEYIENPLKMFTHFYYNDGLEVELEELIKSAKSEMYRQKYVKVIVREKLKPEWFDRVIQALEQNNTLDIQVVDDHYNFNKLTEEEIVEEMSDTFEIIKKYLQKTEKKHLPQLEHLFEELYTQAQVIGI